jgi:hypothetical protein
MRASITYTVNVTEGIDNDEADCHRLYNSCRAECNRITWISEDKHPEVTGGKDESYTIPNAHGTYTVTARLTTSHWTLTEQRYKPPE